MRIPWWRRKRRTAPTEVDYARKRAEADLAFTRAQTPIFEAIADEARGVKPEPTYERGSMNGGRDVR